MPSERTFQEVHYIIHKAINQKKLGKRALVIVNSLKERLREKGKVHPKDKEIRICGKTSFSIVNMEHLRSVDRGQRALIKVADRDSGSGVQQDEDVQMNDIY